MTSEILKNMSKKQRHCAKLLVSGFTTTSEIAKEMGISENVVKNHLTKAFDACGVWNRVELALYIVRHPELEKALLTESFKPKEGQCTTNTKTPKNPELCA